MELAATGVDLLFANGRMFGFLLQGFPRFRRERLLFTGDIAREAASAEREPSSSRPSLFLADNDGPPRGISAALSPFTAALVVFGA